ncbi:hypothetical protein R50076_26670 [Gilvimarinus japonicus]
MALPGPKSAKPYCPRLLGHTYYKRLGALRIHTNYTTAGSIKLLFHRKTYYGVAQDTSGVTLCTAIT